MINSHTEIRKVACSSRIIEYQLTRKPVKNINLRMKPDGKIYISANEKVPADYIDGFVKSKQEFIIQALDRYEKNNRYAVPAEIRYEDGDIVKVLGKNLCLKVTEEAKELVFTDGVFLFLAVKDKNSLKRKEKLIDEWLKDLQIKTFHEISTTVYQMFREYGVVYPQIKIRKMTSRWGSCQPGKRIITLNSRLIEAPKSCIEYVVLHEFAHFIHPNHSARFYGLVEALMPDWRERRNRLNSDITWKK